MLGFIFEVILLVIVLAMPPNRSVLSVISNYDNAYAAVHIIQVLALPPRIELNNLVRFEFRYGMWPIFPFFSESRAITCRRQNKLVLIYRPSAISVSFWLVF